jgi:hypothetical protein
MLPVLVALVALASLSGCSPVEPTAAAHATVPAVTPGAPAPGSTSTAAPRTTSVPAPSKGSITSTVAPVASGPVTKVALAKPAVLPSKVTVTVVSATRDVVKATTPGEIAGPAVVAVIRISNGTSSSLDLGSSVVTLVDAKGAPGQATTSAPANPFTGTVAPGKSLEGVYVFEVPSTSPNPFKISVSYAGGAPIALFAGTVS